MPLEMPEQQVHEYSYDVRYGYTHNASTCALCTRLGAEGLTPAQAQGGYKQAEEASVPEPPTPPSDTAYADITAAMLGEPVRQSIADWQRVVHRVAREHGWWETPEPLHDDDEDRIVAMLIFTKLGLIVTEVAEAMEEIRHAQQSDTSEVYWKPIDGKLAEPTGFPVELADIAIRLFDLAEFLEIDLENVIRLKNAYNERRAYRHGGKRV